MPLAGSSFVSTKPPFLPNSVGVTSAEPSGFWIETLAEQQVEVPIVTPLSFRLTRWPARPSNDTAASWPSELTPTETGAPPGAIDAVTSSGTE